MKQALHGHDSQETAYIVDDYPYGFRLRCKIRYWIETKKGQGQRFCSQTTNPKAQGEVWNKPKKGTYSVVMGMFLDENNHVSHEVLSAGGWDKEERIKEFEAFHAALTEYQVGAIRYIRASNEMNLIVKFKIHKEGEPEQTKEEQQAIMNKALAYGFAKVDGRI